MIKEIIQFVDVLPSEAFSKNLQLKEGLYMFLDIEEGDEKPKLKNIDENRKIFEEDFGIWTAKSEPSPFFERCLQIQANTTPVSPQKIFNPDKKIFNSSCSPFALAFTKKNYKKYQDNKDLLKNQLKNQYFKSAEKYITKDFHKNWFILFRDYLTEHLHLLLTGLEAYQDAKDTFTINIYFKRADLSDYIETHAAYLKENVFNKAQYNVQSEGDLLGISDSLSGFNDKKRFLQHKTGFPDLNYRITGKDAQLLWKFFKLQQNGQLPNPTPVFIDKEEFKDFNTDVIKFHQDDRILSHSELVKKLLEKHNRKHLQNYYLIFFQRGLKGSRIIDLDFVPVFHYEFEKKPDLREVFKIGGRFPRNIHNVFDLLHEAFNKIFNNQLIQKTKDGGVWLKFFDELEVNPKYHFTDAIVNLMYKYRKAVYDYIYKSRHQQITCKIFDDMLVTSIVDDILHDDDFNREYSIKEKLNIWFNLWDYFAENQNRINMANKTFEIMSRLRSVIDREDEHINDDDEFAFAVGQLIWKILIQNKSANRSHALLEPFLQKVEAVELKKAIARTFDTYKHEFVMYPRKYAFDKLMSEAMGYEPKERNMKNLIHMILAGYFAESLFKKEKEQQEF